MMQLSKRMIVVSLLVPAILVGLLSLGMAVRQLQRDTAITAEILLGQVDHVTSIARHTLHTTAQMANQPCENVVEKMTETGALTPYIRSTGLVRGDTLVCSSITGSRQQSIRSVYGLPLSAEMGSLEITAINGTRSVPHQTAIIYASGAGNGITVFSVVDGRYFTDLMETLDDENHAILRLRFSDGPVISSQDKGTEDLAGFSAVFNSDFSQARIQIITPWQSLARYLVRNMIFLGPASLLLTLATLYLWRRWLTGKLSLADEIAKGMARGEFVVHYQPVCEAASGMCTGAEALMRWQRAEGSSISPALFIQAAEEEEMIISLTRHLFGLIAADVKAWQVTAPFHLGVNIAAAHLTDDAFTTDVLQFRQSLAASFRLVLEVTERSLVDDTALASENLNALRQHGCQVAVDDFGTGYCSLSLLHNLPVDYLKIDKIFIDTLTSAGTDTPVLDTIIGLSKRLGLATIAEGVSTQQQAEWLKDNRVSYVQGYLYARPMPAADFISWYEENNRKRETGRT